jgi:hypothetical protein
MAGCKTVVLCSQELWKWHWLSSRNNILMTAATEVAETTMSGPKHDLSPRRFAARIMQDDDHARNGTSTWTAIDTCIGNRTHQEERSSSFDTSVTAAEGDGIIFIEKVGRSVGRSVG